MIITWLGHSCFKIQTANANVLIDPYDPGVGLKMPKVTPDFVLITHDHSDHNYLQGVSGSPFVANGPGEYEVRGVFAQGVPGFHDATQGTERGGITMYRLEADDLKLAHLGDLGQPKLTDEQFEQLNGVDILFVPVGGFYTIDAKAASDIITQLEPRIVIPMHYFVHGMDKKRFPIAGVDAFMKVMGVKSQPVDKLKIVKKELPQEETQVVILKPDA